MVIKNPTKYEKGRTIVYFVRHGDRKETNDNSMMPGPGLSKKGLLQAKTVAKEFEKIKSEVDKIYSSSMARTKETATEISKRVNKKIIFYDELAEFNKFLWLGRIYHHKFWKHYIRYSKAKKCFNNILKENKGKVIVIVCHGNVIKGLVGNKMNIDFKKRGLLECNNCYITKIAFIGTKIDYLYYYNSNKLS